MNELQYSSAIKDLPFLYLETRKTALFLMEGKTHEEIVQLSVSENIYQLEKEKRRKELPQKILKRLDSLNRDLIHIIAFGNNDDAKLVTFLSIIKTDRLFFEFMEEVYFEKYISKQYSVVERDFVYYFNLKTAQNERVAGWQKTNLEKVKRTYIRILIEAGFAKQIPDGFEIKKPFCSKETLNSILLDDNEYYAKLMLLTEA